MAHKAMDLSERVSTLAENVAQWWRTCLECLRSWVWIPISHTHKSKWYIGV
jgi:hypothetical protein